MRIGIDARFVGPHGQGLGRYAESLIQALAQLDCETTYIIFVQPGVRIQHCPSNFIFHETRARWYGFAEQLSWPITLYLARLDLMHFTHFNVPLLYRKPFVVTIHDLILFRFRTTHASTRAVWHFKIKYWLYQRIIKSAVQRAKHILTVSEFSKEDVARVFPGKAGHITVTYEAPLLKQRNETGGVSPAMPDRYALYVGNAYPHKNLDFMITNYLHSQAHRDGVTLVLIGAHDYFYRRLMERYAHATLLMFTGEVSDAELLQWYSHASVYIAPSLYEGFGLPGLEALQCGVPVLASHAGAQPEILAHNAVFFDPTNGDDFTSKLDRLLTQGVPPFDSKAVSAHLTNFSWKKTAQQTLQLYRRA